MFYFLTEALLHLLGVFSTCRLRPCSVYLMCILLADRGPAPSTWYVAGRGLSPSTWGVFYLQADALVHLLGACSTCRLRPCSIYSVCVLLPDRGLAPSTWNVFYLQAETLLRNALKEALYVDRWAAAQCLAYYGECDSEVVGELIRQLLNSTDRIHREQAGHLLGRLSENSVGAAPGLIQLVLPVSFST